MGWWLGLTRQPLDDCIKLLPMVFLDDNVREEVERCLYEKLRAQTRNDKFAGFMRKAFVDPADADAVISELTPQLKADLPIKNKIALVYNAMKQHEKPLKLDEALCTVRLAHFSAEGFKVTTCLRVADSRRS